MRNLKRALSLAVASVMLLGMMVVGTGAASYTDQDDITNVTAVEVLNSIGVMVGNDAGEDGAAAALGIPVFLLTDCLINRQGADLSAYLQGGFPELKEYLARL